MCEPPAPDKALWRHFRYCRGNLNPTWINTYTFWYFPRIMRMPVNVAQASENIKQAATWSPLLSMLWSLCSVGPCGLRRWSIDLEQVEDHRRTFHATGMARHWCSGQHISLPSWGVGFDSRVSYNGYCVLVLFTDAGVSGTGEMNLSLNSFVLIEFACFSWFVLNFI